MVMFNLYPDWRSCEQHFQEKKVKQIISTAIILPLLIVTLMHIHLQQQLHLVAQRVHSFSKKNTVVKMDAPAKFSVERNKNKLHLLQKTLLTLSRLPEGNLCLMKIYLKDDTTFFSGNTKTAASLTNYVTHLQQTSLFAQVEIKHLERNSHGNLQFQFQGG